MEGRDLISVAEAARRLQRSTEQVRRYLREKRLPGQRIGGQWFIDAIAIEAFLANQSSATGFLARLRADPDDDPLGDTIALARGIGSNMADGKDAYRLAYRRRR